MGYPGYPPHYQQPQVPPYHPVYGYMDPAQMHHNYAAYGYVQPPPPAQQMAVPPEQQQ